MKRIGSRTEWSLFATAFIAFAYFHQGGGWNANSRFAMVRAMVEQGSFAIDSYLIYTPVSESSSELRRFDVKDATYSADGLTNVLTWVDRESQPEPINPAYAGKSESDSLRFVDLRSVAASGDVAYYDGHFFPNKAPGTSLIAIPAYWIINQIERLIGANPDNWWTLTINAWLSDTFSVGILSALGVVIFYRLASQLFNGSQMATVPAALTFAFGTMFFPYATSFYEHNIIAVCLLAAFCLLHRTRANHRAANGYIFMSGLCAGFAAITNYIVAVTVVFFGLYLMATARRKSALIWFGLGVLGPFLLICAYNVACFHTPFTTNYRHENPFFQNSHAFLGVFGPPRLNVLIAILFSPFRGLFFSSPVLLMAVVGFVMSFRARHLRAEMLLAAATIALFLVFNISFEAWEGGWAVAPRYLGPAIPFLALGLVAAFARFFKTTCLLGAISLGLMLLITAVDLQPPIGVSDTAKVLDKPVWTYNPITEYELPVFFQGRPWPLIRLQEEQVLRHYEAQLNHMQLLDVDRSAELERFRNHVETLVGNYEPAPISLERKGQSADAPVSIAMSDTPQIAGPVSTNIGGMYGGGLFGPRELQWNSFNAGEFLFPQSRLSLIPLVFLALPLAWFTIRSARAVNRTTPSP